MKESSREMDARSWWDEQTDTEYRKAGLTKLTSLVNVHGTLPSSGQTRPCKGAPRKEAPSLPGQAASARRQRCRLNNCHQTNYLQP